MSILHRSDGQRGIIYVVWDGRVTWEEWSKQIHIVMADPAWQKAPYILADLRSVTDTSSISIQELDQAISFFATDPAALKVKRGAVIARDEFGKARHFADRVSRYGTSLLIFNSLDTACLFLGLDLLETSHILESIHEELRKKRA